MNRLFAIVVLLFVLLPCARAADGPDDQYVRIYNLIQDGDSFGTNQLSQAVAKYTEAQNALLRFQKIYPGWNNRVVNFRLNYLASKITILSANSPGASNEPAPARLPAAPVRTVTTPAQTAKAPAAPATPSAPAMAQTTNAPIAPPPTNEATAPAPPPLTPVSPALLSSEVRTSAPPMIVLPQPGPSAAELQNQIADLQNQLKQLQGEKSMTEAKLREALAARPAGADPREYAQAQEKLRSIEKENELLRVSLAQEREKVAAALTNSVLLQQTTQELADTKRQLAEQTTRTTQLAQENESLRSQVKALTAINADLAGLRTENAALKKAIQSKSQPTATATPELSRQLAQAQETIASLQADKEVWNLEKEALQNRVKKLSKRPVTAAASQDAEQIKQLEHERDDLQQKLDAAQKELYTRKGTASAAHVDELAIELETMRAKLGVYESKPVPYTAEELALFKKPNAPVPDTHSGEKTTHELPAGTAELATDAQKDFSAGNYKQAERKYQEVLRRDPKNINTLANLATVQLEMGHLEDAEKNLKTATAVAPDDGFTLSILGNLKFRQGKYDEAMDALSRAAQAEPQNAEIQNFLGLTLSQKGMRSAAEAAFRKAILLNPNYGGAQNNLAVFYLTQQPPSVELARWHYDKAVAAGFPRNQELEKLLDDKKTAQSGQ